MYEPLEDLRFKLNAVGHALVVMMDVYIDASKGMGKDVLPLTNAREALRNAFYPTLPRSQRPSDMYSRMDCLVKINEEHSKLRELHPHGACIHIERIQVHEYMAFLYPTDKKIKGIPVSDTFMERYKPEAPGYYLLTETGQNSWSRTVL